MWLMRVIDAGYASLRDLHEGPLTLEDFAIANDYLDAKAENEGRSRIAMEAQNRGR
jgi:hypothetical protein